MSYRIRGKRELAVKHAASYRTRCRVAMPAQREHPTKSTLHCTRCATLEGKRTRKTRQGTQGCRRAGRKRG